MEIFNPLKEMHVKLKQIVNTTQRDKKNNKKNILRGNPLNESNEQ